MKTGMKHHRTNSDRRARLTISRKSSGRPDCSVTAALVTKSFYLMHKTLEDDTATEKAVIPR